MEKTTVWVRFWWNCSLSRGNAFKILHLQIPSVIPAFQLLGFFGFFFFWPSHTACGILVYQLGIKPRTLQWKCQGLTSEQPRNSLVPGSKSAMKRLIMGDTNISGDITVLVLLLGLLFSLVLWSQVLSCEWSALFFFLWAFLFSKFNFVEHRVIKQGNISHILIDIPLQKEILQAAK